MSNDYSDPKLGIWQWDQGAYVIQAYTHPIGQANILKVKKYTQKSFSNASMSGAHQLLFNQSAPKTCEELNIVLMKFGCPKSLL